MDIADFIRFCRVCRSWRSAANPANLSPQLPWLLLPYNPATSSRTFFSFLMRSFYNLDLPETHDSNVCASSNGWLVIIHETFKILILNLIARAHVHLPPLIPITDIYIRYCAAFRVCFPRADSDLVTKLQLMDIFLDCYASISPNAGAGIVTLLV